MNIGGILINKEIPTALLDGAKQTAKRLGGGSEKLRFIVVCDLDADSHYGTNLLCVTDKRSFVLDDAGEVLHTVVHADTEEVKVRRMYGNARLVVRRKGGRHDRAYTLHLCGRLALRHGGGLHHGDCRR